MNRALVTGATGFTGSALCRRLVSHGVKVIAFARSWNETRQLRDIGVECRSVDLMDAAAIQAQFPEVDVVYHLAAAYRTEHADRSVFFRVNVDGTRSLLDAAVARGVERFVHCSTVGVQGEIQDPPATEAAPVAPGDHYQESKLQGERLALEYVDRIGVRVVRPVGIYGPGDTRFLKLFRPIARGRFVMIGSGRNLYHLTYIDDLVQGMMLMAASDAAVGEVFTICGPRYTTVEELVGSVAHAVGKAAPRWAVPFAPVYVAASACEHACRIARVAPPFYRRRLDFFSKDRAFDGTKAGRLLGFSPRVDLDEGLSRTADWYRQEGLL